MENPSPLEVERTRAGDLLELCTKPTERGTIGRSIKLITNHYKIKISPVVWYIYDVYIKKSGSEDGRKISDKTLARLVKLVITKLIKISLNLY